MRSYRRDIWNSLSVPSGQTVKLLDFIWPGRPGEIYALGIGLGDDAQWGYVTWKIEVDGMKVPDYSSIQDQIGSFDLLTDVSIPVPPGARVEIYATNVHASAALSGARVKIREAFAFGREDEYRGIR